MKLFRIIPLSICISMGCLSLLLSACAINDISKATQIPAPTTLPGYTGHPILRNGDWRPVTQSFDGVDMVLVPAGCFNMGINPGDTGDSDELPPSTQCFQRPFWIDRTEVTNAQFAQFKGVARLNSNWSEPNRPRTNLRWTEALDFCQLRDARLPNEREWEYAARGPDSLIYPWGNDWQPDNLVSPDNSNAQTANVGSRPAGVSWVDALDMAGNVWEWTSTLYDKFVYPYVTDDQRNNLADITSKRVIRGASWYEASDYYARASNRGQLGANIQDFNIGVRCARDFQDTDQG